MRLRYNKRDLKIVAFLLVIMYSLTFAGPAKYPLVLCVAGFCFICSLKKDGFDSSRFRLAGPAIVFSILGVAVAIARGSINFNTFKTVALYTMPAVCTVCIESKYKARDKRVMNGIFLSLVFLMVTKGFGSLITTGKYESGYAYIFTFFLLYYLDKKNYKMALLCGLLILVSDKRIAILSAILSIGVYVVCSRRGDKSRRKKCSIIFWGFVVCVFVWIYLIHSGVMFQLRKYGISPMGRENIYNRFYSYYTMSPLFFGNGAGFVFDVLYADRIPGQDVMHCDWLQIYVEIGFFGLLAYFYMYYRIIKTVSSMYRPIVLAILISSFVNSTFANINVSIYEQFVSFYLILYYIESEKREQAKSLLYDAGLLRCRKHKTTQIVYR